MGFEASEFYESVALYLIALGIGNNEETDYQVFESRGDVHVIVRDNTGEEAFTVVGKDYNELGEQLVLACLHNVSIEHLGALHLTPLQELPPVLKPVQ